MNDEMRKLKEQMRKLKIAELKPLLNDYQQYFRAWTVFERDTLIRVSGPVLQGVFLERLSYREYRPMGFTRVLVAPGGVGPMRILRSVKAREHAHQLPKMIEAMRREFVPSVDAPLVPEEVLELYEREAIPKSPQAYSLAALNGYLGHHDRALYWCHRFPELVDQLGHGWQKWDVEQGDFLKKLEGWIQAGEAREQLEHVLEAERKKWGLS